MSKKFVLLGVIIALCCAFANTGKSRAYASGKFYGANVSALGGVTNIKEVVNNTSGVLQVRKLDGSENIYDISSQSTRDIPADGVWSGDMWVPWANNAGEFKSHKMTIAIGLHPAPGNQNLSYTRFYVWQSGDYVRFATTDTFIENAPRVPGEARAGGERRLVISVKNDRPVFTFEEYRR